MSPLPSSAHSLASPAHRRVRQKLGLGLVLCVAAACSETTAPNPGFIPPLRTTEAVPAEVVVTPAVDTLRAIGETKTLGSVVVGSDGSLIAQVAVTWSSRSPEVATVGRSSGTVTAVGPGTAIIDASAGPAVGQATILVQPATAGQP